MKPPRRKIRYAWWETTQAIELYIWLAFIAIAYAVTRR